MRLLKKESGDSGEFSLGPLAIRFGHRPPATASMRQSVRKNEATSSHSNPCRARAQGRTPGGRAAGPAAAPAAGGSSRLPVRCVTGPSPSAAPRGSHTPHPGWLGGPRKGAPACGLRLEGSMSLHSSPCQPHKGRWHGPQVPGLLPPGRRGRKSVSSPAPPDAWE